MAAGREMNRPFTSLGETFEHLHKPKRRTLHARRRRNQHPRRQTSSRAYHLEQTNPHTRFFHSLDETTRYMLDQGLWTRDTVERYDFDQCTSRSTRDH